MLYISVHSVTWICCLDEFMCISVPKCSTLESQGKLKSKFEWINLRKLLSNLNKNIESHFRDKIRIKKGESHFVCLPFKFYIHCHCD